MVQCPNTECAKSERVRPSGAAHGSCKRPASREALAIVSFVQTVCDVHVLHWGLEGSRVTRDLGVGSGEAGESALTSWLKSHDRGPAYRTYCLRCGWVLHVQFVGL